MFHTLASGLDQAEREQTLDLIRRRLYADRAAAAAGQRDRQVDVGTRTRARRHREAQQPRLATNRSGDAERD